VACTFGSAATNDVTFAVNLNTGPASSSFLITGWWYPTKLTATRGLFSFGNTLGAEIGATTSELLIRSAHGTTNGQWTTTGVGLTVNQWQFIAVYMGFAASGTGTAVKVWSGTTEVQPVACSITNTVTPAGTAAGGTNFYLGNKGTSTTLAFQGDIGNTFLGMAAGALTGPLGPFNVAAYGTVDANEEEFLKASYVLPVWAGNPFPFRGGDLGFRAGASWDMYYINMDHIVAPRATRFIGSGAAQSAAAIFTVDGATKSGQRSPVAANVPGFPTPRP
jgi:hypothetical protein